MVTYRATLDVAVETLAQVSAWLAGQRRAKDRAPSQCAATPYVHAVMVLRWFKERTDVRILARDAKGSIATAYRYVHEGIDVIAAHAPDLHEVLDRALTEDWPFVALDGTLIASDQCSEKSATGNDAWYWGKHKQHGGNIQVLTDPTGYPVWVSQVEPGSTHDITCARRHAFGALYKAAADGLPTLTDKGYVGAGTGIQAPTERADALLEGSSKALAHITLDPWRIGAITGARQPSSFTFNDQPGKRSSVNVKTRATIGQRRSSNECQDFDNV